MKALFRKIIDAIKDIHRKATRCPVCDVKWVKTNTFFESFMSGVEKYQCPKCGKEFERDIPDGFSD